MLALVAVFACVSFSSCSLFEDEDNGFGTYYCKCWVDTNCLGADGQSIGKTLENQWYELNNASPQEGLKVGKVNAETAEKWFNETMNSLLQTYNELYAGKGLLPEGGWIDYHYYLTSDAKSGGSNASVIISIDNNGATISYR